MTDGGASKFRYMAIYQDIKDKIDNGTYEPGMKLCTENEYREEYGVSRDTIRKAFAKLENEEYIVRRAAVGTFVKNKKSDYTLTNLESFTEQMKARGLKPSSELISIELSEIKNNHIRSELQMDQGEKCYKITRIRKGDGKPMAYEIAYIPKKLCPNMQKYLDDETSLYHVYEDIYHLRIGNGNIRLEAELPSSAVQEGLKISRESPVLKMNCTAYLEDGTPLYYVNCYYKGESYFFSAILPR
ncbi:MAG: GntR family transcriptional regulator [Lachnospiraceae bacterium]|nr:GntR family transcriptional regulator [Lachnospiraceae bacterium]